MGKGLVTLSLHTADEEAHIGAIGMSVHIVADEAKSIGIEFVTMSLHKADEEARLGAVGMSVHIVVDEAKSIV